MSSRKVLLVTTITIELAVGALILLTGVVGAQSNTQTPALPASMELRPFPYSLRSYSRTTSQVRGGSTHC